MTFSPCSHPCTWPGLLSHPSLVPELLSPPPHPLPCSQGWVQNQHSCSCPALKPPMAPHCLLNQSHSAPPGVPDASQGRHGLLVQAHVPVTTLTLSQGAYHTLPSSMLLLMKCPRLECLSTFTTRAGLPLWLLLYAPCTSHAPLSSSSPCHTGRGPGRTPFS